MRLEIDRLRRSFGDFALEDISLRLGDGEYWVLLGPSGCGKSLLLQTLTGVYRPDGGLVLLGSRNAIPEEPERRNIGLVFQQAALFPHYSVAGNIEYGLKARGVPALERKQRVGEMVERLGLAPLLSKSVATLSGGEAQRVAIARALAIRPSVLLLDEPLSLLDHNARLELQAELKRLHQELGLTTLHVTHSRDEARALADHCAVMLGGRVVQSGTADEVLGHPRCPFVASFLGLDASTAVERPECAARCLAGPTRCERPERRGTAAC